MNYESKTLLSVDLRFSYGYLYYLNHIQDTYVILKTSKLHILYNKYWLFFGLTMIFNEEPISLFRFVQVSQKIHLRSTGSSFRTLAMPMLRINRLNKGLKFCANLGNFTENIIVCNKPHPHIICILLQSYNNVFWKVKVHEHIETILLDPAIIFFNFLCRRAFIIIMTFSVFNKVQELKLWLYHSIFLDKKTN